jgi:hypothetical protein
LEEDEDDQVKYENIIEKLRKDNKNRREKKKIG